MPPKKRACDSDIEPPAKTADLSKLFEGVPLPRHAREVAKDIRTNRAVRELAHEIAIAERRRENQEKFDRAIVESALKLQKLIDAALDIPPKSESWHYEMSITTDASLIWRIEVMLRQLQEILDQRYKPLGYTVVVKHHKNEHPYPMTTSVLLEIDPEFTQDDDDRSVAPCPV